MTEPFVAQLRTQGEALPLAATGTSAMTVRVEMPELWETIRVEVSPDEPVAALKRRALEVFLSGAAAPERFVLKLNGWNVLDESAPVASTGAGEGAVFLLTHRLRRPVR